MSDSSRNRDGSKERRRCRELRGLLLAGLEGELAPADRQALDEHLASCPRCSAELSALRETMSLLEKRALPEPDEAFWTTLRRNVSRELSDKQSPARRRPLVPLRAWVPVAAAVSLLAVLLLWWSSQPRLPRQMERPLLVHLEQSGRQSLADLGQSLASLEEFQLALTPGDSLAVLLAELAAPVDAIERIMLRADMAENPELWDEVLAEECALQEVPEDMIKALTETQLEELSTRLRRVMG